MFQRLPTQVKAAAMKKLEPRCVGAGVEVAVAEMADAVAPAEQGSLELIEAIYREHGSRFRRVAAAILGSAEAAEDVV